MARMESRPLEEKDRLIWFKAFSSSKPTGRSADSIPRVFGNFGKSSSSNDPSLRRTRSFKLPRVLRKDKEDKQSFSLSFVLRTNTNQKEGCQAEKEFMKGKGKGTTMKQKTNCERLNGQQSLPQKIDKSTTGTNQFLVPTICIQTPEEVNLILQLQPMSQNATLEQGSTRDLTHDRADITECNQTSKENPALQFNTPASDKDERKTKSRRKRSASWGGEVVVSCSGDLKISAAGELKTSMSWSAFLNSDTSRETDLCSTEL